MNKQAVWHKMHDDQRGLTLVEILAALVIIAIISVTFMSYFVSALEKSADESRRIIAANLARLKAAEIRHALKPKAEFDKLYAGLGTLSGKLRVNEDLPADFQDKGWLNTAEINGTVYKYILELDSDLPAGSQPRRDVLENLIDTSPAQYLIRMTVTVSWGGSDPEVESRNVNSTQIDTYIVNRGD